MSERLPISLLVLTHNNYRLFLNWLDMAAKFANVKEIIILDNGSDDETQFIQRGNLYNTVLNKYDAGVEADILHIRNNLGVIAGRNILAQIARQPYIMFLDDDQFLTESAIRHLYSTMQAENLDAVGAISCVCDKNGVGIQTGGLLDEKRSYIGAGGMLVKRGVFDAVGGFSREFGMAYCEDPDLTWKLREAGYKVGHCENAYIAHKAHSTLHTQKTFDNEQQHARSHEVLMEKWPEKFEDGPDKDLGVLYMVHDRYEIASKCLDALIEKIDSTRTEIYILLNGVEDDRIKNHFNSLPNTNINIFESKINMLCAPGRHYLIQKLIDSGKYRDCKYYMFLDDDVEIVSDGIEDIVSECMNIDDVCCVQGLLLNDDMTIQDGYSFLNHCGKGCITRTVAMERYPVAEFEWANARNCFTLGGFNVITSEMLLGMYPYMQFYKAGYADYDYYFRIRAANKTIIFDKRLQGIHHKNWNDPKAIEDDAARGWRTVPNRLKSIAALRAMWSTSGPVCIEKKKEFDKYTRSHFGVGFDELKELGFETETAKNIIDS